MYSGYQNLVWFFSHHVYFFQTLRRLYALKNFLNSGQSQSFSYYSLLFHGFFVLRHPLYFEYQSTINDL